MARPIPALPSPRPVHAGSLVLPWLLVLAACTGPAPRPYWPAAPYPEPRRSEIPRSPEPVPAVPRPAEPPPAEQPAAEAPAVPPAVVALQEDAALSVQDGNLDNAASSLERAIRIQPKNAELWHDLAEVRLKQEQPVLAEDLAKKSNTLAQGNTALIRANWAVIAEARRLQGDDRGAAEAAAKAGL